MREINLLKLYPNPRNKGLFRSLITLNPNDIGTMLINMGINNDTVAAIDMDYILNHSGLKKPSMMLYGIYNGLVMDDSENQVVLHNGKRVTWDYVLQLVDEQIINDLIGIRFATKWNSLYETLTAKYDIFKPFSMNIKENGSETLDSSTENHGTSSTESTSITNDSGKDTTSDNTYGFNSNSEVPSDKSVTDSTSKSDNTRNDSGKNDSTSTYGRTNEHNRSITRDGNIGNISNQELLKQQREVVQFEVLPVFYNDLDSVLTRSRYSNGRW